MRAFLDGIAFAALMVMMIVIMLSLPDAW